MFEYRYPRFQSKRLLRAEMLEELRDFPLSVLNGLWDASAQGVVAGCSISWSAGVLTIGSGILYANKQFYLMREPYKMPCEAVDKVRYLKVRFLPEETTPLETIGATSIILEERPTISGDELELCRFRLQEGARLRDKHENFEDCSTEFDTVDFTYAPWAGRKDSVLNPMLIRRFAKELLDMRTGRAEDLSFSMAALAAGGRVDAEAVREYIRLRTGKVPAHGVRPAYEALLAILKEGGGTDDGMSGESILLI